MHNFTSGFLKEASITELILDRIAANRAEEPQQVREAEDRVRTQKRNNTSVIKNELRGQTGLFKNIDVESAEK